MCQFYPVIFITVTMASSLIKNQIASVIRRFKFEELENAVMPIFPEISWNRMRSKLMRNHKNFTTYNATRIIQEILDNASLQKKDVQDRLTTLEVIDISRHYSRRIWYGYELKGLDKPLNNPGKRMIQESIKQEFYSNGINMIVKIVTYNDITFVHIKEQSKKRRALRTRPIFFALFVGHKYLFCSIKNVSSYSIKAVTNALGYKDYKRIKLVGRDLKSLIRILWIKQQGALHIEGINQPVYETSNPIFRDAGWDYTQEKQRKKYAEQCFGKDPPTLELLVIKGPRISLQHHNASSILPTDNIHMNWEFRSRNIAEFLTNLTEKHAFVLPLPDYVSNFMKLGKNELTLQVTQARD